MARNPVEESDRRVGGRGLGGIEDLGDGLAPERLLELVVPAEGPSDQIPLRRVDDPLPRGPALRGTLANDPLPCRPVVAA